MHRLSLVVQVCKNIEHIDGKQAILQMKEEGGNWRQMEWIGWYYEYLLDKMNIRNNTPYYSPTGRKVYLDYRIDGILTDLKTHVLNSNAKDVVLNDRKAIEDAVKTEGIVRILLLKGNAVKDDENRSFQKWHCNLANSNFNPLGRQRKKSFDLTSILLLEINQHNICNLNIMNQGKNSNGKPRPPKFLIKKNDVPLFIKEVY